MKFMKLLILPLASFLLQTVSAGAYANVNVCVKWEGDVPKGKVLIDVSPGVPSYTCMNQIGRATIGQIWRKGFNCVGIGDVEIKASSSHGDTCATDNSFWWVTIKVGNFTWSLESQWYQAYHTGPPAIWLKNYGNSVVCGADKTEAECDKNGGSFQNWPGNERGQLYIVFRVGAGATGDILASKPDEADTTQHLLEQSPADELK